MKKAVLYARCSTERQKEEKTINSQIAILKEKIKEDGNILVEQYIDEGWTGETLDRPALGKLREDARNGAYEILYIYHLDRLSRELGNQLYAVNEFKRYDIEIYTSQGKLEDDPNNKLLMQMQGIVAEQEKLRILERTRTGKLQKAKRGVVVGSIAPYGYIYIKKQGRKDGYYLINQKEAEIIKNIYNWFIELRSIRAVVKKLQKEQIAPPNNTKWGKSTVHRILHREDYIGTTYYNKYYAVETKNGRERKYKKIVRTGRRLRDKKDWIPISVPSIIDKEIYLLAQSILGKNRESVRRGTTREYLLSGLISCDICGSPFCSNPCHDNLFYRCNNRNKTFPLPKTCDSKMIGTNKLDNIIWETTLKTFTNPDIVFKHLNDVVSSHNQSLSQINRKIGNIDDNLKSIKNKENKLVDVFSEGLIDKAVFTQKIDELKAEETKQRGEVEYLEKIRNSNIDKRVAKKEINYFCKLAKKNLEGFDFEKRKQLLNLMVEKVILNTKEKRIRIKAVLPFISDIKLPIQEKVGLSYLTSLCRGLRGPAKPCLPKPCQLFCRI